MKRIGSSGLHSEINVTPLVDVVLVLLIIFMVIVPLTLRGYDVDIPTTDDRPPSDTAKTDQVVLAIELDTCPIMASPDSNSLPENCRIRLGNDEFPASELAQRTAKVFNVRPASERVLFLAADDELNYEGVMRILDAAKTSVANLRVGIVNERPRIELDG